MSGLAERTTERVKPIPSEAARMAEELEETERAAARERMKSGANGEQSGETREIIAKQTGYSWPTLVKIKTVLASSDAELIARMDANEISIEKAYQTAKQLQSEPAPEKTAEEVQSGTISTPMLAYATEMFRKIKTLGDALQEQADTIERLTNIPPASCEAADGASRAYGLRKAFERAGEIVNANLGYVPPDVVSIVSEWRLLSAPYEEASRRRATQDKAQSEAERAAAQAEARESAEAARIRAILNRHPVPEGASNR